VDRNWESCADWITTQKAADNSGYDIQHIHRLPRQGKIGAVKRGYD